MRGQREKYKKKKKNGGKQDGINRRNGKDKRSRKEGIRGRMLKREGKAGKKGLGD